MKRYEIAVYTTEEGEVPFHKWLNGLKDEVAKTKIVARLDRASFGLFGDSKPIKGVKGLFEMREHYGSGYRIFYCIIENKIVLLLAGSIKSDQKKAIAKAKSYLADYEKS